MKKYEINELLPLSIYDLRVVGRNVGVKSPTSMKRNDLIQSIIAICNGEQEPALRSNRGRPAKNANSSDMVKNVLGEECDDRDYIAFVSGSEMSAEDMLCDPGEDADRFYEDAPLQTRGGILEILAEGYGFLREEGKPSENDIYISNTQIKRFCLKNGDCVQGAVTPSSAGRKYAALMRVESVNGLSPDFVRTRKPFESLTPVPPKCRFKLGTEDAALRLIDLLLPLGKGQRGLIVAPPRSGRTALLKKLANTLCEDGTTTVYLVLVDERPEEITALQRSVKANVFATSFDEPPQNHVDLCERTLESAKRQVECGRDVVVILDNLTRLSRAYNIVSASTGRVWNGGLNPGCLYRPKRFFAAARNTEEEGGGSLTVIATVLSGTESQLDEAVKEEFNGTANWELYLSRELGDRRVFPAMDVFQSGNRFAEQLLTAEEGECAKLLRAKISGMQPTEAMETLLQTVAKTDTNEELLAALKGN